LKQHSHSAEPKEHTIGHPELAHSA
jgi:hypothetical protein